MSGPVPITSTAQIDFHYTVLGVDHVAQVRCDVVTPTSGTNYVYMQGGGTRLFSLAADDYWSKIAPFFKSTDATFGEAILQRYDAPIYVPVQTFATAIAPTGSSATGVAIQATFTFRNNAYDLVKQVFLDTIATAVGHYPLSVLGAPFPAFINSWLGASIGDIGAWGFGRRANTPVVSFGYLTVGYNRKQRRIRGFV